MKFEIMNSTSITQPYFWRAVDSNGADVLARSETLHNKADAVSAAQTLKDHANDGHLTFSVISSQRAGEPWTWHVTARNGRILIAATRSFRSWTDAQNAMESVKRNAPFAVIEDKTQPATVRRW